MTGIGVKGILVRNKARKEDYYESEKVLDFSSNVWALWWGVDRDEKSVTTKGDRETRE